MPVLAGASFNLWEPDFGNPYGVADPKRLTAHLLSKAKKGANHSSSAFNGLAVRSTQDHPISRARIAFRYVTNSTNQRTTIACLAPPGVALLDTAPYLLRRSGGAPDEAYLLGVMCSIPFDWYARRWVELHLNAHLLSPMPVPRPDRSHPLRTRLVELSGRLAAFDDRFQEWASAVGVPIGTLKAEPDRSGAIVEIDALVSHLYGLSWDQVQHMFETFHRGWNYSERLAAVKRHYDQWKTAS